jgi:hypothetical protein
MAANYTPPVPAPAFQIPVIGEKRSFEMLPQDLMQQFSSKQDIYDYLKRHLQVS